jgi:hypothetical protein
VTWVEWNLVLVSLKIVSISKKDRSTVCLKHAICAKSYWMHLMVLLGDEAQGQVRFGPFGDRANLYTR